MFAKFNSDSAGEETPNDNGINKRAASFFKMAANQAQQFANNANTSFNKQAQQVQQQHTEDKIIDELAANDRLLHTRTPEPETMTQPVDEEEAEMAVAPAKEDEEVDAAEIASARSSNPPSSPMPGVALSSTPTPTPTATPTPTYSSGPPMIVSGIDISKLAPEVRSKMKKFAKYEEKYPILFDAYKTEKLKNSLLDKFENLLGEHTPCSKISESEVLFHYLKDLKQKNVYLNDEIVKTRTDLQLSNSKIEQENSKFQIMLKNVHKNESRLKELEQLVQDQKLELEQKAKDLENSKSVESTEDNSSIEDLKQELTKLQEQIKLEQDRSKSELDAKDAKIHELEASVKLNVKVDDCKDKSVSPSTAEPPQKLSKSAKKKLAAKKKKQASQQPQQQHNDNENDNDKEEESIVKETEIVEDNQLSNNFKETHAFELRSKEELIEKQRQDLQECKQDLANAQDEIEHLRDSLRDVGNELVEFKSDEQQSEKTLHLQHTEAITHYEREVMALKEENKKLISENDTLSKQRGILAEKLKQLEENKDQEINYKLQIDDMRKTLIAKDKLLSEKESRIKYLDEEKNSMNEKFIDLKVMTEKLKIEMKASNEQSNKKMTENEQLKEELKKLNLKFAKLNSENSSLIKANDEIRDKLADARNFKSSNNDQVANVTRMNDELNVRIRELQKSFETLEDELNDSRTMLQERTRETSTIRKMLLDLEDEKQALVKDFESRLVKRADEIDRLNFEINKNNKKFKQELNDMKLKLDGYEEQIQLQQLSAGGDVGTKVDSGKKDVVNGQGNARETLLDDVVSELREQLSSTLKRLKDAENVNSIMKKLNEDLNLKFEKLNKNYRLQQHELKKQRSDSIDLQRRLSSTTSIPMASTISRSASNGSIAISDTNVLEEQQQQQHQQQTDEEKISYVKNVLLGYIEKKDQRANLLPVVKMLLHLDKREADVLTSNLK